jgi:hypothetical protein
MSDDDCSDQHHLDTKVLIVVDVMDVRMMMIRVGGAVVVDVRMMRERWVKWGGSDIGIETNVGVVAIVRLLILRYLSLSGGDRVRIRVPR